MAACAPTTEQLPTFRLSGRRALLVGGAGALMVASLVLIAPALADLPELGARLLEGDPRWLLAALAFEALSFVGHIVLLRAVLRDGGSARIDLRASTDITLAGHAATRLLASAGAGGVALTAWALRRSGMRGEDVAARMATFLVLLYGVYMGALVVGGVGLAWGVLPGPAPAAMTLLPAAFGLLVIALAVGLQWVRPGAGRTRRILAPVGEGVRSARSLLRRGNPGLLGALMWWGFDIAVLGACFAAFGDVPPIAVLVVAYFVGMLANTLPLPGGVGGVDGGMIAALIAFGVDPAAAVVAVLAYRVYAFWLPIAPGAISFLRLRRTVDAWSRAAA